MSTWGPKVCALAVSLALVWTVRIDRAWANGSDDPFADFKVASTETLSETRGGFLGTVAGRSLDLAFGIEQAILINDQLVVSTRLTVPNINRPGETRIERVVSTTMPNAASAASGVAAQSAAPTTQIVTIQSTGSPIGPIQVSTSVVNQLKVSTVQSQAGQLNLVQIGAGNTLALNLTELPQGTLNVIQNTLDNQTIRQATSIQITANTASLVRMMNFGAILQRQIAGSVK